VPNNAFADSVVWQDDSNIFKSDNIVNESVQADLNGHLWSITQSGGAMTKTSLVTISDGDPLYYSPAVAGFPTYPVEYSLYAFSTGSFYSTSAEINGADVGTTGNFIPKIYIAAKNLSSSSVASVGIEIQDIPDPDDTVGNTLGQKSQVIAPPLIFTPDEDNTADPFALYLIYDPDGATCVGISYIARVNFDPTNLAALASDVAGSVDVYEAGEGMAGGFALAGEKVLVSQSGVGQDEEASLVVVPDLTIPIGGPSDDISWWVELQ
jgi:hypothetical protein